MLNSKLKQVLISLIFISISAVAVLVKINLFASNTAHEITFPDNPRVILAGDSHGQVGFATEFINSSVNICQSSERSIFTYYKLKKILESKNNIETVILSYSYHSLAEIRIKGSNAEMLRRYHLIVDDKFYNELHEQGRTSSNLVLRYLADIKKIPIGIANDIVEYVELNRSTSPDRFSFLGGYIYDYTSIIGNESFVDRAILRHYYLEDEIKDFDISNIIYYQKISDFCMQHGVKLYLVNTPVHKAYYTKIPKKFTEKVDSLGHSLSNEKTTYVNLSQVALPDSCFGDYDHLNWYGSIIISKYLDLIISGKAQVAYNENHCNY